MIKEPDFALKTPAKTLVFRYAKLDDICGPRGFPPIEQWSNSASDAEIGMQVLSWERGERERGRSIYKREGRDSGRER